MISKLLWTFLIAFSYETTAFPSEVRRVPVKPDQIVPVNTALGIATIIQVPDKLNSLVVGDSESFKIEYLDQAITVKPTRPNARSNLYIYTDWRRFNVQLASGVEAKVDYVVYLEEPKENAKRSTASLNWTQFRNRLKSDSVSLEVERLGRTRDGLLVIEFKVSSDRHEVIDPKWFWIVQGKQTRPIHRLVLSQLEVDPRAAATGTIHILNNDVKPDVPIRLELRRRRTSYLTIPEVRLWR